MSKQPHKVSPLTTKNKRIAPTAIRAPIQSEKPKDPLGESNRKALRSVINNDGIQAVLRCLEIGQHESVSHILNVDPNDKVLVASYQSRHQAYVEIFELIKGTE